jgi:tetratricopeptide (TPR) repeat protein
LFGAFDRLRRARERRGLFRAAHTLHRQGRLVEAERLYRGALGVDPRDARSRYSLGLIHLRRGEWDDALAAFRRALEQDPDFAEAHNAAGLALRGADRRPEALAHFRQAVAIRPGFSEAHNNLGATLQGLGDTEAAVEHYRKALAANPGYAEAHNNLGAALRVLERCEEAVEHFRKALAVNPDYAEAHCNLGAALGILDRHQQALPHFQRALAIRPGFAEAHCNLGASLQQLRQHDAALAAFERALAIKPDLAEAHHGRGTTLRTLGRLAEGRRALERAVALAPRKSQFYGSLAESKRFTDGDPHLAMIEALAHDIGALSEEDRMHLDFALGKVYADLGRHEQSFSRLLEGNALKRKRVVYDEAAAMAQLELTRELFTSEAMRKGSGLGDPSSVPVFIIGMPRSGTSLVEQILASHPQVHGAGELSDFEAALASLRGPGARPGLGREELRRVSGLYLERLSAAAPAAARITDKMPANFRYAGLIHLALPNARIIHTRRDPVDTCLSCFSILFGRSQLFTYDLAELGRYYRGYAGLMEHWRQVLPPEVMLEVRYEELVADFATQARRIVAHCGLDWNESCLHFHNTRRPVWTASAVQVRQPIYRSSVGRAAPYRHRLGPLLDALATP